MPLWTSYETQESSSFNTHFLEQTWRISKIYKGYTSMLDRKEDTPFILLHLYLLMDNGFEQTI